MCYAILHMSLAGKANKESYGLMHWNQNYELIRINLQFDNDITFRRVMSYNDYAAYKRNYHP